MSKIRSAKNKPKEIRLRSILLAIVLTVILALSNAYLALKLGILTSASIPAAIISMGILRFFKNSTMHENNMVQTAASAGEAVAGGITFSVPALIIIQYWQHFDYWTNFFIALLGGILGVLFTIPLRKILVRDKHLKFPEGRAIAEILKTFNEQIGLKAILIGGMIGSGFELFQSGFKIFASQWNYWFFTKKSLIGFDFGFSTTMIGAGYLIGFEMGCSIILGAIIAWMVMVPITSPFYYQSISMLNASEAISIFWNNDLRYLGIGAMLLAGLWTCVKLIKPLHRSLKVLFPSSQELNSLKKDNIDSSEKDIPTFLVIIGIALLAACLFILFHYILPIEKIGLAGDYRPTFLFIAVVYILIIGFIFAILASFFSGLVGVSASPGSAVVILGILMISTILIAVIKHTAISLNQIQLQAAEAITIIIASILMAIASIANDNMQDLKVGHLIKSTPWKQQLMLILGVLICSLVIPYVMQMLYEVYGIAGNMPHPGMNPAQTLPAPAAALMATITEGVFKHTIPWNMVITGMGIIITLLIMNKILIAYKGFSLSLLGAAIGMYLPMSTTVPIFIGGLLSKFICSKVTNQKKVILVKQKGSMAACGLVAGSSIMEVILTIPYALYHNENVLSLVSNTWMPFGVSLSFLSLVLLFVFLYKYCNKVI